MLDHWDDVVSALDQGIPCAAATIIRTSGSVPRPAGTSMVVTADGGVLGSLTGGCVEAAVLESALEAIADGKPRTESFGYSDGDAFAVGLSCGGSLDVHILPLAPGSLPGGPVPSAVLRRLDGGAHLPLPVATEEDLRNALVALHPEAGSSVPEQLAGMLAAGHTGILTLADGECGAQAAELFLECRAAAPALLLLGANDYSAALSRMGAMLGYRVTVADGRPVFTDPRRFPEADAVVVQWPDALVRAEQEAGRLDASSVICLLSHDAKFDVPALAAALQSGAGYVGAMGSRRTNRHRLRALRNAGVPETALARLHAPIGLDIGAVTPAEVALSVFAEVTASRSAASGMPLRGLSGPIHSPSRLINHLTAS
ncbi:XdhC family protein [Arthrobacter sp. 7Tela_A1]|uniref:XdhC family protein n=1 Tax=Arthrobacter sp. 7Tela_A1 TaxID=3093745 RepID=UPI003BB58393